MWFSLRFYVLPLFNHKYKTEPIIYMSCFHYFFFVRLHDFMRSLDRLETCNLSRLIRLRTIETRKKKKEGIEQGSRHVTLVV